ncbi:SpoIIE family protein phosphatase [Haloferula sp. A504]|uniref:SpoIIE family protein phosphatase n=1 Tax=Haloferula sp. A504 TaxID=3373601 RepID=UPI0031BE9D46|nr:serine/threonine-protein phosphatase [Verrucomicrobiaceae bacterium E54]
MSKPDPFFDIEFACLNHHGEELCGDQVRIARTDRRSIVVLADGLGSGVKANILACLTAEIIVRMSLAGATAADVMDTVIGTLPADRTLGVAYSAFTLLDLIHADGSFRVISFEAPAPLLLRQGRVASLERYGREVRGRTLLFSKGRLELGDFLGLLSDGVLHAGVGELHNFGWDRAGIGRFIEETLKFHASSAGRAANRVIRETNLLYGGRPGDDATFVGVLPRAPRALMVVTGPAVDRDDDESCTDRLMAFPGRKVVCGGTTSDIIGAHLGVLVVSEPNSGRDGIPPIGRLPGIDLVTEGIMTMAATLRLLDEADGSLERLPGDRNGAALLARELLQADSVSFLVGEQVNPYYQNPQLPRSVSIRRNLVVQLIDRLKAYRKEVTVEWC